MARRCVGGSRPSIGQHRASRLAAAPPHRYKWDWPDLEQQKIEKLFSDVWRFREETVYPRMFGSVLSDISLIPPEFFSDDRTDGQKFQPPPLWLHYGVLRSPADSIRNCWAYVSSGLSNPSPDQCENPNPAEPSGIGFELVMFTAVESPWAARVID